MKKNYVAMALVLVFGLAGCLGGPDAESEGQGEKENRGGSAERKIIDAHLHIDKYETEPTNPFEMPDSVVIVDEVLAHMDDQEVGQAVIMQHPIGTDLNEVVISAVNEHPDRFKGAMIIKLEDADESLKQMEDFFSRGLTVLKIDMFGSSVLYPDLRLDSELLRQVYSKAEELGIVVAIDPFRPGFPMYQPDALAKVIPDYPELKFVICHLGVPMAELMEEPENNAMWKEMTSLARYDNVWFDLSALPDMYEGVDEYPYEQAIGLVREFVAEYGADKGLWGSDIVGTLKRDSYQQLIDMFMASEQFTDEEKNLLFYENSRKVYFN